METFNMDDLKNMEELKMIERKQPHKLQNILKLPFGRLLWTKDRGSAMRPADMFFSTHLGAHHFRDGHFLKSYDLGSGKITNVGVMSMSNDWQWSATLNLSTLGLSNTHATGTGTNAEAATDVALQTLASPTTVTGVLGTQTTVTAANTQIYKNVATINYTSTLAITEWGLHNSGGTAFLTSSLGSPFTAVTATTGQDTGSTYTASSATVRGLQGFVYFPGTTTVWGMIASNTTHVATLLNNGATGWWKISDGTAGSTPGNTETYTIRPMLWDRKMFSAINVVNGDSIQFTYQLTINSGT